MFNRRHSNFVKNLEDRLKNMGIKLNVLMEVDHLSLLIQMVKTGMGASFLPLPASQALIKNEHVKQIKISNLHFPERKIYLIHRNNRFFTPAHLSFMDELIKFF